MKLRTWIFVFICLLPLLVKAQDSFRTTSVLNSGSWYKIKVEKTGIYKLTFDDLIAKGFNTPENIRVYGQSGKQLLLSNEEDVVDDLVEIPLYSGSNYYLFYGEGVESAYYDEGLGMYKQKIHNYAKYNYYYITASFGAGERIVEQNNNSLSSTVSRTTYDFISYYEQENENLINTGRLWFSNLISDGQFTKQFHIKNIDANVPVQIRTGAAVRSESSKNIYVYANNNLVSTIPFSALPLSSSTYRYAYYNAGVNTFSSSSGVIDIKVSFNGNGLDDKAYIDYILLNGRSRLMLNSSDTMLFFRDRSVVSSNSITKFTISGATNSTQVWDITNSVKPVRIIGALSGTNFSFKSVTDTLKEFVAVNLSANFPVPIYDDENLQDVGKVVKKQNIHGEKVPELLVVSHPAFLAQAKELAQLHIDKDDMSVLVVTTEQVYNEFSSGKPDASAIRNMARMFYERSNEQDSLKYLLLFGDGSYDNRTIFNLANKIINPNYIPTYQSEESLDGTGSYVSDDFYAVLGVNEGIEGRLCIGVGRIPVNSDGVDEVEAQEVVDKIKAYYDADLMSDWRNNMIFLGDDGEESWDANIFVTDSDSLTEIIKKESPTMNISKVYLDAYQQISSSTGASYPEVEGAMQDYFRKGALVFNYMGHGGEGGITQEHVLTKSDFENMSNGPLFPVFVTATCQLGRYDNVTKKGSQWSKKVSAGEAALLNPNGGAIALLTTTRVVYQSSNFKLSKTFYENFFKKDHKGKRLRLGDILRISKNESSASRKNTLKFALLGDPAITLAYGEYKVVTDSVNGKSIKNSVDTLNALNEVTISGYIANVDSSIINSFNGVVFTSVYDKSYDVTSNGNDNRTPVTFTVQDKLLFRGLSSVENGRFSVTFKVPKDISYSFGKGKISYYAHNEVVDAKGYYDGCFIGGTATDPEIDMEGPDIELFMNDLSFIDGGITNPDPILIAEIYDTNGINTTGNGIGHNLSGILDNDLSKNYMLNDYYVGDTNSYRRGSLEYQLNDLEEGYHNIEVKVWDTYNNSSDANISFYVVQGDNLIINELLNYPNPAKTHTTFQYSHNSPGTEHSVQVKVYDISGRLVYSIDQSNNEDGFVSEPIVWDFSEMRGSRFEPGVYPYQVTVSTSEGNKENQTGSLIIIP